MPQGGMDALETKDPLDIYAYQYDLVCNGVELSSGAVRNHDPEIMVKAFQIVGLKEDDVKSKFPAMYNAFCYGAPPHAGIAPGVDRMVMLIAGEESIREIIPFPMNKTAQDVMMGAPSAVDEKQLRDVHIKIDMLSRYVEVGTHRGVGIDIVAVLGRNGHSAYAEVYEADRMIACGARAG